MWFSQTAVAKVAHSLVSPAPDPWPESHVGRTWCRFPWTDCPRPGSECRRRTRCRSTRSHAAGFWSPINIYIFGRIKSWINIPISGIPCAGIYRQTPLLSDSLIWLDKWSRKAPVTFVYQLTTSSRVALLSLLLFRITDLQNIKQTVSSLIKFKLILYSLINIYFKLQNESWWKLTRKINYEKNK